MFFINLLIIDNGRFLNALGSGYDGLIIKKLKKKKVKEKKRGKFFRRRKVKLLKIGLKVSTQNTTFLFFKNITLSKFLKI